MLLIRWDTSTWLVSTSALPNNATYSNRRIVIVMMIVMLMKVMVFILIKVMMIILIMMPNNKEHVSPYAFQMADSETC